MSIDWKIQGTLNNYQAIPVLGFVVVSPTKALVSTVQIVAGLVSAVFNKFVTCSLETIGLHRTIFGVNLGKVWAGPNHKRQVAAHQVAYGIDHFLDSIMNIVTLGLYGYRRYSAPVPVRNDYLNPDI